MPGKNFKRPDPRNSKKGRKTRGNSAPVPPSNPTSKMSNKPPSSSSGAQTRGRRTNNSQKGRPSLPAAANKPPPVSAAPPNSKKNGGSNGKGGPGSSMKSKKKTPDYSFYTAEDQTIYKPGDYAYVDSQQSDQPYHICLINSFKGTRKDTVTAEVKWFYRVCELPEAVYYQLMEDRKLSEYASTFELASIRDRELFAAFNVDTHPAHLFRGKCVVEEFSTITDMASFLPLENHFFYQHGYKPESRRMTKMDEFSFIPYSQQAELPDYKPFIESEEKENNSMQDGEQEEVKKPEVKKLDRYSVSDTTPPTETLIWKTNIDDDNLLLYLRAARSVALHAGVCMQGLVRDGYMAASSDETTQQAFDVLHSNDYDTEKALLALIKKPNVGRLHRKKNWSKEHSLLFAKGMRQFGKNFRKIKNELLPNKEITELIEYYYYWKKTTAGLSSRNTRKQRKQFHIRMSRAMMKPEDKSPEPEKEFIDVSSGEEEDMLDDDGEKCFVYHACRHCYSTESSSWHHSGSNKTILCNDCRLYFRKYSCMRPLTVKREPPPFMFKDYHVALAEESRRKTRNSNNVRLPHAGLRNGKIFSKSDSDEDEEGSETSEFSSTESFEVPVSTNKRNRELQQRRSLMDILENDNKAAANISGGGIGGGASEGETSAGSEPSEKKIKEEKDQQREGTGSDEDVSGSGPSTSYARDDDEYEEGLEEEEENGRKSLEEQQSSSQSPESSVEERSGPLSATTPKSSVPFSKAFQTHTHTPIPQNPIPQSFMRVSKDTESSCARTDLVYVHPSPEERKAIAQPQKAIPHHIPHLTFGQPELPSNPIPPPPQLQSQTTSNKQQVPTITTYDPHLPSGPGHFIGFPMPPNLTPTIPPGADPASIVAMAARQFPHPQMAREDIFLWQQQQQQQQALAMAAMQKQLESGAAQHVTFQPGGAGPHIIQSATEHTNQQQQGMIFQFPSPEEMARLQRSGHTLHSLPEGVIAAHPHHPFHPIVATPTIVMDTGAHHHDDGPSSSSSHHHQPGAHHHPHQPMSLSLLPNNMVATNLEAIQQQQQLLLQQQQQQQNPQVALLSQEHVQDLQRRYILYMQEYQKNPSVINNHNFQSVVSQYQQLEQYMILQQQQQQQELLLQQELLKHQQQQQKYAHQSSSGSSSSSSAARPGVIMNLHTSGNRN